MQKTILTIVLIGTLLISSMGVVEAGISQSELEALAGQYNIHDYAVTTIEDGVIHTVSSADDAPLVFEAGSLGKPVAAYLCLQLAKGGRMSLDDAIGQYLDADWLTEDDRLQSITIRQLLSHTAGFSPSFETGVDKRLYFEPGSRFSYSGVGYIYLQQIIESVYGGTLEQAAQEYVFCPLGMQNSTFEAMLTTTPYVKTSSLVVYIIFVWCAAALVIYLLGFVFGLLTKFKFYSKRNLFVGSAVVGFIADVLLLAIVLPRLMIPALVFGGVGLFVLWATRKSKRLFYVIFSAYMIISAVSGLLSPSALPIGAELFKREANAAYSLKTTSQDMACFIREMAEKQPEMLDQQVSIDETNAWGLGVAIENVNGVTTYWHSGINPGMQSLFVIAPEANQMTVVMTNSDHGLAFAKDVIRRTSGIPGEWEIVRVDLRTLAAEPTR